MQITLTNTGKRFNREWIFRHCHYQFKQGHTYAITGPNGSGKSTLLQVIAGAVMQSEGEITYTQTMNQIEGSVTTNNIPPDQSYRNLTFAAPYLELIEEMTAMELLRFHATFKPLLSSPEDILKEVNLEKSAHKQIRYFSSGMKQRLKLAQAFFSRSTVLLLDEPTTNLDKEGIDLYHKLAGEHSKEKLVIVSSNDPQEYHFCKEVISISNYK